MNNWHRKLWKLDPIDPHDEIADLYLSDGSSNEFWFEPFVDAETPELRFRVAFAPGAMAVNWRDRALTAHGQNPFSPEGDLDDKTEQLEGTLVVGTASRELHVFIDTTNGAELLRVRVGQLSDAGAGGGWATGQNSIRKGP